MRYPGALRDPENLTGQIGCWDLREQAGRFAHRAELSLNPLQPPGPPAEHRVNSHISQRMFPIGQRGGQRLWPAAGEYIGWIPALRQLRRSRRRAIRGNDLVVARSEEHTSEL